MHISHSCPSVGILYQKENIVQQHVYLPLLPPSMDIIENIVEQHAYLPLLPPAGILGDWFQLRPSKRFYLTHICALHFKSCIFIFHFLFCIIFQCFFILTCNFLNLETYFDHCLTHVQPLNLCSKFRISHTFPVISFLHLNLCLGNQMQPSSYLANIHLPYIWH